MTTTIAWMSQSGTGRRTFYLGADSRGTPFHEGGVTSNSEKKTYASKVTPEIFCLSGDLQWGNNFLRMLVNYLKVGKCSSTLGYIDRPYEFCKQSFANPPRKPICQLEVLYGVRRGAGRTSTFHLFELKHTGAKDSNWSVAAVGLKNVQKNTSSSVFAGGKGGCAHLKHQKWLSGGDQGDVSRTSFWSLCDLVEGKPVNNIDTGGVPQLVKIDQCGCASEVGVYYFGKPTVSGSRVTAPALSTKFWVNENFTHLDPKTMEPWSLGSKYGRRFSAR